MFFFLVLWYGNWPHDSRFVNWTYCVHLANPSRKHQSMDAHAACQVYDAARGRKLNSSFALVWGIFVFFFMTLQVFPLEVTREWTSLRFAASWRSVPQHCCHNIGVSAVAVAACCWWCYWLSVRARAGAKQGIGWNRMEQHEIQCLFRNGRKLLANSTVLFFFWAQFCWDTCMWPRNHRGCHLYPTTTLQASDCNWVSRIDTKHLGMT